MRTHAIAAAIPLAFAICSFPVAADEALKFRGGIGVIPVSNVAGTANADGTFPNVTRNIVRGVNPPGQIWVIEDLRGEVDSSGRVRIDGRGLLLGGGNGVGTNANQSVMATLICEAAAPFTLLNTPLVPLEPNGDFRIDDSLSPAPPAECASPVLLIRNPAGAWFAAGIVKR